MRQRGDRRLSRRLSRYFTVGKMYSAPLAALGHLVVVVFKRV
jgi:hypothetical protein